MNVNKLYAIMNIIIYIKIVLIQIIFFKIIFKKGIILGELKVQ